MTTPLVVNGVTYNYPVNLDTGWGAAATGWAVAVTGGMLQKGKAGTTQLFTLLSDVDFGANYGLYALYFNSISSNIGTAGVVRLANTDTIDWANASGTTSADNVLGVNGSNQLTFNGTQVNLGAGITKLVAGTGLTGGTITTTGTIAVGAGSVTNAMLAGSIAASKLIGTDIATVGTITAGSWQGNLILGTFGGTGVNNGASTITIGGNLTFTGAHTFTGTLSSNTSVTFPTSGTLLNSALTAGDILVGNASNLAAAVAVSGDATLGSTGALTLSTVNSNVGTFQGLTVNAKGLVTAATNQSYGTGSVTSVATNNGLTGGPVTTTGTIGLATIANNDLLANTAGSTAIPVATTLTTLIDSALGSTQGDLLYRGASAWTVLAPGTSGQVLVTNGAGSNPAWSTGGSGSGSVTKVVAGAGLTGGTITTTGTVALDVTNANTWTGLQSFTNLDFALLGASSGSTKLIASATASGTVTLPTSGVLGTGSVTDVTAGTGLTGGSITNTGTIALDVTNANTWTGLQSFTDLDFGLLGSTSGSTILRAAAIASGTVFIPTSGTLGTGSVVSIATNNGLTGGAITNSGTIGLATISNNDILSNISGSTQIPVGNSITSVVDTIGSTQGDILYRGASNWSALAPGTSGQVLVTNGAGSNPQWQAAPSAVTFANVSPAGSGPNDPADATQLVGVNSVQLVTGATGALQGVGLPYIGTTSSGCNVTVINQSGSNIFVYPSNLAGDDTINNGTAYLLYNLSAVTFSGASATWFSNTAFGSGGAVTTGSASSELQFTATGPADSTHFLRGDNTWASVSGTGSVTSVATGTGLTGGPVTTSGTISIGTTGVTAGTYGNGSNVGQFVVNALGQITAASNVSFSGGGGVTSVATNSSLTGGPITTTGTLGINLSNPNTWLATQTIGALVDSPAIAINSGAINFNYVAIPTALSAAKVAGSGLGTGVYQYVVTYLNTNGETSQGASVSITTTTGSAKVNLSSIPTSADASVLERNIYRTAVGGTTFLLLTTLGDNTTTTYADTTADVSLGTAVPAFNNTSGFFTINEGNETGVGFGPTSFGITATSDLNIYSPTTIYTLATPTAPTVATHGTTSTGTFAYKIVAAVGNQQFVTAASTAGSVTTGASTLNSSNYNQINWNEVYGATEYLIYRTQATTSPSTTGLIATVTNGTNVYLDQGAAGNGSTAPTLNTTGKLSVQGTATIGSLNVTGTSTLGHIGSGLWAGSVITGTYGGLGVNNGASTITIGGNVTFSGASTFIGTLTGNTSVTFPTSGTLATTASAGTGTVTSVATGTGLTGGPVTSTGTVSVATNGITLALLQQSVSGSVLLGAATATTNYSELVLGTGLSITSGTLNASGGGGGVSYIAGSGTATATGANSLAIGGLTTASQKQSTVFGYDVTDTNPYTFNWAPNAMLGTAGDATVLKLLWAGTTTTSGAHELFLGGDGSTRFTLGTNSSWLGQIYVIGRISTTGTSSFGAIIQGVFGCRSTGSIADGGNIIGEQTANTGGTTVWSGTGASANVPGTGGTTITVTVNAGTGSAGSTTVYWAAYGDGLYIGH